MPRFRRIGVIANFQPLWAYADPYMKDLTWPALRKELWTSMYPIRSLLRSGAVLAFGSDWSVTSLNPLEGIQVALTRQSPDEEPIDVMQPDEAIDLPAALAAYTIGAAYAMGLEKETGSIEAGKRADLVVLADNLFDVPARRLGKTRVLLTLVDGVPVYEDAAGKTVAEAISRPSRLRSRRPPPSPWDRGSVAGSRGGAFRSPP